MTTKAIFLTYMEEMEEEKESPVPQKTPVVSPTYEKVFIVHGHNGELKQSVARIIEKQGIEAIILSEQANKGRTIIEKFEDYSDVGGAICLFTADDLGRAKKDTTDNTRARQNVVLETGYFMGKLGRDHVVLLADKGIEMPSDLSGVVYTDAAKWEIDLLKELKEMGYAIDFNKLF
jgi:predicted nucleotide-binding protein